MDQSGNTVHSLIDIQNQQHYLFYLQPDDRVLFMYLFKTDSHLEKNNISLKRSDHWTLK